MNDGALGPILEEALGVWKAGGWAMVPLALNGLVMYGLGMMILLKLWSRGLFASPDRAWRAWRRDPARPQGTVGGLIADAMDGRSMAELEHFFAAVRSDEVAPFERDLRTMRVSVSTAPLLGLLGTVTGMLTTFYALATGSGGEKTMAMIAGGISEALITTETGLVLALTGLILQFVLTRQHSSYSKLIEHVEVLCMQELRRRAGRRAAAPVLRPVPEPRPVPVPDDEALAVGAM